MAEGMFLHSLREFREIIFSCFTIAGVHRVLECGTGTGEFTADLHEWARRNRGTLVCIEPFPCAEVLGLSMEEDGPHLVRGRSLDVLDGIEACDAYLLDSDHNYHTVFHELLAVERLSAADGRPLLVFVHDVGAQSGRRDFYFDPDSLPSHAVHAYRTIPAVVGMNRVEFGERDRFHLAGALAMAEREGGPRNGVLTAVEDFLAGRPHLALTLIPCIFGLAVIHPRTAPFAAELERHLAPYHENPLLARLEENRLALFMKVMEYKMREPAAL